MAIFPCTRCGGTEEEKIDTRATGNQAQAAAGITELRHPGNHHHQQSIMSRYYSHFAPYVSVAQRRINAQKELQKLQKKGRTIEPLGELSHRARIATSFWGSAWCKHLDSRPELLFKLRTRLRLTRPAFAAKLGVSAQSIANWETKGGPLKLQAASLARLQILALEPAPDA